MASLPSLQTVGAEPALSGVVRPYNMPFLIRCVILSLFSVARHCCFMYSVCIQARMDCEHQNWWDTDQWLGGEVRGPAVSTLGVQAQRWKKVPVKQSLLALCSST